MITVRLLLMIAHLLPYLPRSLWLPVIRPVRTVNNYGYRLEHSLRSLRAVGLRPWNLAWGYTNFATGVASYGVPAEMGNASLFSPWGTVYFVDSGYSGASDTSPAKTPRRPGATIDGVVAKCTASTGDVIIVAAGHAETVSAAAGLDLDVAGITVLGCGRGSDRPTITLDTATTADIDIDAANIRLVNVVIDLTGVDAIVAGVDVNAAGFLLKDCRVIMSDSGGQAVLGLVTDAAADYCTIEDCEFIGSSDAGPAAAIRFIGNDHGVIRRLHSYGDYSVGNISMLTTAPTNVLIEYCDLNNLNAVDVNIEGIASATGTIRYCTCRNATDAQTTWINTPGSMQLYENYGVNNNGERGIIIGTASV